MLLWVIEIGIGTRTEHVSSFCFVCKRLIGMVMQLPQQTTLIHYKPALFIEGRSARNFTE